MPPPPYPATSAPSPDTKRQTGGTDSWETTTTWFTKPIPKASPIERAGQPKIKEKAQKNLNRTGNYSWNTNILLSRGEVVSILTRTVIQQWIGSTSFRWTRSQPVSKRDESFWSKAEIRCNYCSPKLTQGKGQRISWICEKEWGEIERVKDRVSCWGEQWKGEQSIRVVSIPI